MSHIDYPNIRKGLSVMGVMTAIVVNVVVVGPVAFKLMNAHSLEKVKPFDNDQPYRWSNVNGS